MSIKLSNLAKSRITIINTRTEENVPTESVSPDDSENKGCKKRPHWSSEDKKVFYKAVELFGKNYAQIYKYIITNGSRPDRNQDSIRLLFNRVYNNSWDCLLNWIKRQNPSSAPVEYFQFLSNSQGSTDIQIRLVLIVGFLENHSVKVLKYDEKVGRMIYDLFRFGKTELQACSDSKKEGKILSSTQLLEFDPKILSSQYSSFQSPKTLEESKSKRSARRVNLVTVEPFQQKPIPTPSILSINSQQSLRRFDIRLVPHNLSSSLILSVYGYNPRIQLNLPCTTTVKELSNRLLQYWKLSLHGGKGISISHLVPYTPPENMDFPQCEKDSETDHSYLERVCLSSDILYSICSATDVSSPYEFRYSLYPSLLSTINTMERIEACKINECIVKLLPKVTKSLLFHHIAKTLTLDNQQIFDQRILQPRVTETYVQTIPTESEENSQKSKSVRRINPTNINLEPINIPDSPYPSNKLSNLSDVRENSSINYTPARSLNDSFIIAGQKLSERLLDNSSHDPDRSISNIFDLITEFPKTPSYLSKLKESNSSLPAKSPFETLKSFSQISDEPSVDFTNLFCSMRQKSKDNQDKFEKLTEKPQSPDPKPFEFQQSLNSSTPFIPPGMVSMSSNESETSASLDKFGNSEMSSKTFSQDSHETAGNEECDKYSQNSKISDTPENKKRGSPKSRSNDKSNSKKMRKSRSISRNLFHRV